MFCNKADIDFAVLPPTSVFSVSDDDDQDSQDYDNIMLKLKENIVNEASASSTSVATPLGDVLKLEDGLAILEREIKEIGRHQLTPLTIPSPTSSAEYSKFSNNAIKDFCSSVSRSGNVMMDLSNTCQQNNSYSGGELNVPAKPYVKYYNHRSGEMIPLFPSGSTQKGTPPTPIAF
ncbi:hypothetical protein DAPPUDRAFT_262918 [Daphnia pulex]|uniref:Uncharacterized protein n=1 Tax=Daphnia pulex TaxID=6669 RepID=E9HNX5_DAPPU|nr:hypothetical protein DAPPUDRAFT_262918 [Daphnia pulex]|eukprot:EFX66539.1 hypothetical protein DAPPUDRAFT_262918 [Daphnia pulex]